MSDEAAFIRRCLEDGRDMAPWLIYADWLTDRGRWLAAEFIRLFLRSICELAEALPNRWPLWIATVGDVMHLEGCAYLEGALAAVFVEPT